MILLKNHIYKTQDVTETNRETRIYYIILSFRVQFLESDNSTGVAQENVLLLRKNAKIFRAKQQIFASCFPTVQREKQASMCR